MTAITSSLRRRFCRRGEGWRATPYCTLDAAKPCSRCQIASTKATRQIPRPHIPVPVLFQANPESFRSPPCRSSRRTTVVNVLQQQLSGPMSGLERRILLAPNQKLRVLISIIFKLRRKIGGRGAGDFTKSWEERGGSSPDFGMDNPSETWEIVTWETKTILSRRSPPP